MSLIEQIKQDQLNYRKTKQSDAATLLTTLIGESEMIGKNAGNRAPSDEEVQAVIKKFIKNNTETIQHAAVHIVQQLSLENELLESYLPAQLDEASLKAAVAGYLLREDAQRNMGAIMGWLKQQYGGNYDGKTASAVVKAALV
jgi:uncharacterized protein YqeY